MKKLFVKTSTVNREIGEAQLNIIERLKKLSIDPSITDEIVDIVCYFQKACAKIISCKRFSKWCVMPSLSIVGDIKSLHPFFISSASPYLTDTHCTDKCHK